DPQSPVEHVELDREVPLAGGQASGKEPARRKPERHVPAVVDPRMQPQRQLADELEQQVQRLDRAPVRCTVEPWPGGSPLAHGALRGRVASARMSENCSSGSSQRSMGVQPPASSSVYWLRRSNLWLFSVWIVSPLASAKCSPETSNSMSSRASRCISMRAYVSFQRAT